MKHPNYTTYYEKYIILIVAAALFLHFYPQPELEAWFEEQKTEVLKVFSDATDTKVRLKSDKIYQDLAASVQTSAGAIKRSLTLPNLPRYVRYGCRTHAGRIAPCIPVRHQTRSIGARNFRANSDRRTASFSVRGPMAANDRTQSASCRALRTAVRR